MRHFLLILIFLVFIISSITFFTILYYLDPFINPNLSIALIVSSVILGITSFLSLFFYLFKKVYYRGEVDIFNVFSSLRQGFLISLLLVGLVIFYIIGVFSWLTGALLFIMLLFVELIYQNA